MPRPKRAKVASTARVAKPKPVDPAPRRQQVTKPSKTTNTGALESFSDDSDGLVVKSTRAQRRMPWQPEPQEDVDVTMTGALPITADEGIARPAAKNRTPAPKSSKETRASKGSARGSSASKSESVSRSGKRHSTRADARHVLVQEEDSSSFGDNLLSFTSLDSESPAHGTRPPSAIKVGATPAHETSILALTNFKRRPRQPSLLRMVHQTTDVEDHDLDDLVNFDDFLPDAESTPLHGQKSAPTGEIGNDSGVNLSSSGSRGTKRKLSPIVQVPRSSPPRDDPPTSPDIGGSRSPSPSLPELVQSTEDNQANPETGNDILSETMAPPMSSSDYHIDEVDDPRDSPATSRQRRSRKTLANGQENEDSETEETERPRKSRGRQKAKTNKGISTAKLQALLPHRRTRLRRDGDEEDFQSSGEELAVDSDEDELALPQRRQTRTARKSAAPKPAKKPARAAKKSIASNKGSQKNARTYGRRGSSDKENADTLGPHEESGDEEVTIEAPTVKPSATLEAIAKKFEEVDDFELDFESVSYVPTSSSPWR